MHNVVQSLNESANHDKNIELSIVSSFFSDSQSKNVNTSGTTSGTIFCSSRHQQTLAIQYVSNISEMFKTRQQQCIRFCDNNNNQHNDIGIFAFNKHLIVSSENVIFFLYSGDIET